MPGAALATGGKGPVSLELASPGVLGDSASAAGSATGGRATDRSAAVRPRSVGGRAAVKAAALFSVVTVAGIAEVALVGLPGWVNLLYVVAGLAVALDWLHQQQRRGKPREASRWLESRTVLELPAPAADPPVPEPDAHEPAETEPDAYEPAETERLAEDIGEADAAAEASLSRLRALGYTIVPSDDHEEQLALASRDVNAWCEARGVTVLKMVHDIKRAGDREASPALAWALERIAAGEADTLVVPSLQCLAPTVGTLPPLLRWFTDPHRTLVALDLDLDTATDAGRKAADALAGVGSWEQERLSAQTRRGLEAARSRGAGRAGAAVADVPELRDRIVGMREQGMTLQAIADTLNEEGVATLRGGAEWRPSSVQSATGYRRPPSPRGIRPPAGPAGAGGGGG
jgi:DNA invertase Pin-like site-specific DNA recombinase